MDKNRLIYLFQQRYAGVITPAEEQELLATLNNDASQPLIEEAIQQLLENPPALPLPAQEHAAAMIQRITPVQNSTAAAPVKRLWRSRMAVAAAVLLLAAGSVYLLRNNKGLVVTEQPVALQHMPQPGKNGAVLTLENGQQVVLDSMGNGKLAAQSGADLLLQNGSLTYRNGKAITAATAYNTMTTPRGREFQLLLADGTRVWLNAASSIRFPTRFTGGERRVEITGEAYFEVAADKAHPFYVTVNNKMEVAVLGTAFNINAYDNSGAINTTLLEGGVRVTATGNASAGAVLVPGQQAQLNYIAAVPQVTVLKQVNTSQVMAWKNGLFNFENISFAEAMHQLERWYNIKVEYEKGIPNIHLAGKISRNVALNDLLKGLEGAEVHFKLEAGNKLKVFP